ncbi:putative fungal zinc cluster transcription factor [Candida maltosa Xu316]|uniref:Putative fungal zinc cluster transcription factor n=1 Tax=Candida maltosa (strain Xu316) TaxID=1245528 RepID=M3HGT7_CANMX|nr:putative fungal zinc cluster transcription factor [Candida maltosa Xu316]
MSDLLSYSIMNNTTYSSPNKKLLPSLPLSGTSTPLQSHKPILPPISSILSSPPPQPTLQRQQSSNYVYSSGLITPPHHSHSIHCLTESNLSKFETTRNTHGLGLLSSAVLYEQQSQQQVHFQPQIIPTQTTTTNNNNNNTSNTPPPSLTSRSSSVSSLSAPNTPELLPLKQQTQPKQQPQQQQQQIQQKRRQRLGPSCDSCRLRKVKCDAEIIILTEYDYIKSLVSATDLNNLITGKVSSLPIVEGGYTLLYQNEKFIKFKSCQNCYNKLNVDCCFKNGYTKEDIMFNKKKSNLNNKKIKKQSSTK